MYYGVTKGFGGKPGGLLTPGIYWQGIETFIPTLFDAGLETYLTAQLGVPIFPGYVPIGSTIYPVLVYVIIDQEPYYSMAGPTGLVRGEINIKVYGNDANQVEDMSDNLRVALDSYRGFMGNVLVTGCRYTDNDQDDDPIPDSSDQYAYILSSDWAIDYIESKPTF